MSKSKNLMVNTLITGQPNQGSYANWLSGSAQYSAQLNYMQSAAAYANSG